MKSRTSMTASVYEICDDDVADFEAPAKSCSKKVRRSKDAKRDAYPINSNDGIDDDRCNNDLNTLTHDTATSKSDVLSNQLKEALHQWMCAFRKRWANWWNYLPIEAVNFICKSPPTTIDALAGVPGIGVQKAQNIGELVLATLHAFFEKNDILYLFPNLVKPVCEDCPTWKDPLSDEAAHRRVVLVSTKPGEISEIHMAENRLNTSSVYPTQRITQNEDPQMLSPANRSQSSSGKPGSILGFQSHSRASTASSPPGYEPRQPLQYPPGPHALGQQAAIFPDIEPRSMPYKRPNPYVSNADKQPKRTLQTSSDFFYSSEG